MDGVLEGAVVWCACKLACSLLFLPSLAASHSSISFCCCCLIVFTDFLVTASLGFICIFESWLTIQTSQGDAIALRFLLFLGHTYGIILLLIIPLIAVETLTRLVWTPHAGEPCYDGEDTAEKEEKEEVGTGKDKRFSHLVSYLCCLSVWVVVALNVRCRSKLEDVWAAADCLQAGDSFLGCLPNLLSPLPWSVHSYWDIAFFSLLMFLLAISVRLDGQQRAPERTKEFKYSGKIGIGIRSDGYWQELTPFLSERADCGKSTVEMAQGVDQEKTESSCIVHKVYSWNGAQTSTNHHGDIVLIPPDFLSGGKGGQEKGRTKRGIILTFIAEDHVDWEHSSLFWWGQRGFPCLGVNVMIGLVGVLAIFVLPLNVSVNILLIRTVETVLVACIRALVSSARNKNNAFTLQNETLI